MKLKLLVVFAVLMLCQTFSLYAVPARIQNLAATNIQGTQLTLTWTVPAPGSGYTLDSYDVRMSTVAITAMNWSSRTRIDSLTTPVGTAGSTRTAIITGLTENTVYYFGIKTKDSSGVWTMISNIPPNLRTAGATYSLTFAWDPSDDPSVVGYTMYRGLASRTYTDTLTVGNVTTASFTNQNWGTNYFFTVTAVDVDGIESGFSNELPYPP